MSTVRVATFNCENLFARYRFKDGLTPQGTFTIEDTKFFEFYNETSKQLTAKAIRRSRADIIGLQEVENLKVLDKFVSEYLGGLGYKHRVLIDCINDPRGIDIGLISKFPITSVRTFRGERNSRNTAFLWSRDLLRATVDVDGKELVVYVNHFKSMLGGRENTKARRQEQAKRVAEMIKDEWGPNNYDANYVVLGDLNDYPERGTALTSLLRHPGLVEPITRLPASDRWTHYYPREDAYRQLDYLLLSNGLDARSTEDPIIVRNGLPHRADRYVGPRFGFVGENTPKASDHALLAMDLTLA